MSYSAPSAQEPRTMFVLRAYRAYAVFMLASYLALAGVFAFVVHMPIWAAPAIAFAALYAVAALSPREPWAWTLGLVAIGIGVTGIGIVFAIPLLRAWLRPTTKAAYRRLP